MPTSINKICVDSRFRTFDSPSTSNFKIELKESFLVPENYGAVITDICIPRSWRTVEDNNNRLYIRVMLEPGNQALDYIAYVPSRNYSINTLGPAIAQALNTAAGITQFVATVDATTGSLTIRCDPIHYFCIFTDNDMQQMRPSAWKGPAYNKTNLQSANNVLSNSADGPVNVGIMYNQANPFVSGFINTLPYDSIFITCNQLSAFENIGPRGERNLLKKVLVNEPYGGLINDNWINEYDFTNVSKQLLRTLEFKIVDPYGNELNLHGATVSFSVLFIDISSKIL